MPIFFFSLYIPSSPWKRYSNNTMDKLWWWVSVENNKKQHQPVAGLVMRLSGISGLVVSDVVDFSLRIEKTDVNAIPLATIANMDRPQWVELAEKAKITKQIDSEAEMIDDDTINKPKNHRGYRTNQPTNRPIHPSIQLFRLYKHTHTNRSQLQSTSSVAHHYDRIEGQS